MKQVKRIQKGRRSSQKRENKAERLRSTVFIGKAEKMRRWRGLKEVSEEAYLESMEKRYGFSTAD
jgi:hypothetical protein